MLTPRDNTDQPLVLSRDQVRRIDELSISHYAIPGLILMENAGRSAAEIIRREFGPVGRSLICCGVGNNGGDGYVIARHLHNAGWTVRLARTCEPERLTPDALANFRIVDAMKLRCDFAGDAIAIDRLANEMTQDELVIDALLGTGFSGEVRSPLAEMIQRINSAAKRAVVAVDVPSGLDCETGSASQSTIRADLTITFVAVKRGFLADSAKPFLGQIAVADIGAPRELIRAVGCGEL